MLLDSFQIHTCRDKYAKQIPNINGMRSLPVHCICCMVHEIFGIQPKALMPTYLPNITGCSKDIKLCHRDESYGTKTKNRNGMKVVIPELCRVQ
jgi:hypothetical protein